MPLLGMLPAFLPLVPVSRRRSLSIHGSGDRTSLLSKLKTKNGVVSAVQNCQRTTRCTMAPDRAASDLERIPEAMGGGVKSEAVPGLPEWRYAGAPLSQGPLPAIVYFALTATQSLELDPFNQYVTALLKLKPDIRVFSMTLPLHSDSDMSANEAVFHAWADAYRAGGDVVTPFIRRADSALRQLITHGYVSINDGGSNNNTNTNTNNTNNSDGGEEGQGGRGGFHIAGLSRGGLLAGLLAARNEFVRSCLLFAPVSVLQQLPELAPQAVAQERAAGKIARATLLREDVVDALVHVPVRVYMGNSDTRVGTRNAFDFTHAVAERAANAGIRSPPHEFIMYCRYVLSICVQSFLL